MTANIAKGRSIGKLADAKAIKNNQKDSSKSHVSSLCLKHFGDLTYEDFMVVPQRILTVDDRTFKEVFLLKLTHIELVCTNNKASLFEVGTVTVIDGMETGFSDLIAVSSAFRS